MRVSNIKLNCFRNITELDLSNLGATNILVGLNAQGKTNILEAIYSAAIGGSFRVSQNIYLIKSGSSEAVVFVDVVTDEEREKFIQLYWDESSRVIKINGTPASRNSLIKTFPAIIFSPEDIDLLRLSPAHRRRFMDLVIGRHNQEYVKNLVDYQRIRSQRNQLLLMIKQQKSQEDELDVWDEKMAQVGVQITQTRIKFIAEFSDVVKRFYHIFSANGSNVKISFVSNIGCGRESEYLDALKRNRSLDIVRVTTARGIHRDDLIFMIDNQDIRYTASRGEFRSTVLALKFAEGEYLKNKLNENPVYLLDDVFSELDDNRRQAMVDEIKKHQSFITTNDKKISKLFDGAKVFEVNHGEVKANVPAT